MSKASSRIGCLLLFIVLVFLLAPAYGGLLQLIFYGLFGWITFPAHTIGSLTIEPAALAVACGALLLMVLVAHGLGRWLYGHFRPAAEPWRLRWTASGVFLAISLFGAGIATIAAIHQAWWLVSSKEPILESSGHETRGRITSINNLKQIGLAAHLYHDRCYRLPPGGTFNEHGEMQHSWETILLPFMEYEALYRQVDQKQPWSHRDNVQAFQTVVREFNNPAVPAQKDSTPYGYALSHYAANRRVLGPNTQIGFQDATDGTANTIMAGEVNANFKPWGHPINWRDPADGLNKSPDGFGSPRKSGVTTQMLMMDGSVRSLPRDTDPAVLKALATPAGGEKLPDNWQDH
jgi:hypothetical protein